MKKIGLLILSFSFFAVSLLAQNNVIPDFTWGNVAYFNLNVGESFRYLEKEISLLSIENLCNTIVVEGDTINLKISQRSVPGNINGVKIFVADNRNLSLVDENMLIHGLLKKDALIAVCSISNFLLDENHYVFPVNFNEGFMWNLESDDYLFSAVQLDNSATKFKINYGIDFNLQDDNGMAKHWMVAIENSKVVWIKDYDSEKDSRRIAVLLESESQSGIYYFYGNLYHRNLEVREGQKMIKGELIGTVLSEKDWGSAYFSVLKSDTIPGISDVKTNVINFFPQLFELYFNKSFRFSKLFSKGNIVLGNVNPKNEKNNLSFEEYTGKGWLLDCWDKAGKVPFIDSNTGSNARLKKVLFEGTNLESKNPENYFDYEINVNNGTYRIRVKVGDIELATWQKVEFENRSAGEFSLSRGEQEWTAERIVRVEDGRLTVRIYVDPEGKAAGISEIVFQRAL